MAIGLLKGSSLPPYVAAKSSAQWSTNDGILSAPPTAVFPKVARTTLAVCLTPSPLDHFAALALQQQGQNSTLGKSQV
jgi:hypothetical protein